MKRNRIIVGLILIVLAGTFSIASPARADEEAIKYIKATLRGGDVVVSNSHPSKSIAVTVMVVGMTNVDDVRVERLRETYEVIVFPGKNDTFNFNPAGSHAFVTQSVVVDSARFN